MTALLSILLESESILNAIAEKINKAIRLK